MINNIKEKIERFEQYMKSLKKDQKIVGVSVAFVHDNEVIYTKGFGSSRLNPKQNITPNTIISIQSITKSFAAISIMHLVEKGLIKLDEPLVKYLKYFRTSNKEKSDKITVRQLLSHTAGFPGDIELANMVAPTKIGTEELKKFQEEKGISDEYIENVNSFEDITRYFAQIDLKNEPGQNWQYCTDAYVIVGDLFEKVSGTSWYDFIQEKIFDKLGMTRSTLKPSKARDDKDSAHYYIKEDSSIKAVSFPINEVAAPVGFIYSTASDMAKYLAANMNYEEPRILNTSSLMEMQKPYPGIELEIPMPDTYKPGYGFGWMTWEYKGLKTVNHGGGYKGVRTFVNMIPSENLGIVILSNFDGTDPVEISNKAVDLLLDL